MKVRKSVSINGCRRGLGKVRSMIIFAMYNVELVNRTEWNVCCGYAPCEYAAWLLGMPKLSISTPSTCIKLLYTNNKQFK